MKQTLARTLFVLLLALLSFSFVGDRVAGKHVTGERVVSLPKRPVFLVGELTPEQVIALGSALETPSRSSVMLLSTPKSLPYVKTFLDNYKPDRVVPVGPVAGGKLELEKALDRKLAPVVSWLNSQPWEFWEELYKKPERVVLCPRTPRPQLLQAACLAGALGAPLIVTGQSASEEAELAVWLKRWGTRTVYCVGGTAGLVSKTQDISRVLLADEEAVAKAHLEELAKTGSIDTIVVTNPADTEDGKGGMSTFAPWLALQRRAALVLTNPAGDNVEDAVRRRLKTKSVAAAEYLFLVGNLKAIPMHKRPNPIPADKDPEIEMEPFTPTGSEPYTFAVGRLFHDEPSAVPLIVARRRLLAEAKGPRKVLLASDPGSSLPLLEVLSKNTLHEFRNAGYETRAMFGKEVTKDSLRQQMPDADVFLWEGHHNTLIKDYAFPQWDEPLRPSLVFLQSCLALADYKVQPALHRGAVGVVGSSTRIYSASGSACSLAFFDAILYENRSLGGALRQAKNFLHAYAQLKEKRLGKEAQRTGANLRSAWAFTLWGDPTLHLPEAPKPESALAPIQHAVHGNTIKVSLPETPYTKVVSSKYQVQMLPNARLAGLLKKEKDEDGQPLMPFVFAEVSLPHAPAGRAPQLHSRLPSSHWVFTWDERRKCGYLLVTPREKDRGELQFRVSWAPTVRTEETTVSAGGE